MTDHATTEDVPETAGKDPGEAVPYRVFARKYRPGTFADLIGQEVMVRTLKNAIAENRLAHAFILTGVRGVGKTTTARLIARALNCAAAADTPTMEPCGTCEHCLRIAESRHVDVLEMDAASRTGVEDIRDIIDGVRYAPVSARFKVYIIDEVHMLSKNAFNALLKTLEEPPEHVKFIFATTEIRKVPVTVLSRCQRFDLRRVETPVLIENLKKIAAAEGARVEDGAFALIARAAEGSVRDAQSLLDQAVAHGGGTVSEEQVRAMLGVAERALVLDLLDAVMKGDITTALTILRQQYENGADPEAILQDLLDLVHWLTRRRVAGASPDEAALPPEMRDRGADMAQALTLPVLSRAWQMLLKGLEETRFAPAPITAAEMVIIRLAYSAGLPTPGDLARQLSETDEDGATPPERSPQESDRGETASAAPDHPAVGSPEAPQDAPPDAEPQSFRAVVELAGAYREAMLKTHLVDSVHLVRFRPGHIDIRPTADAPGDLATTLAKKLKEWTGRAWVVSISQEEGRPTLRQQEIEQAMADPLVQDILATFPDAEIAAVRQPEDPGAQEGASGWNETAELGKDRR